MYILKIHIRALRFVRRRHSVRLSLLDSRYGSSRIRELLRGGYLISDARRELDPLGVETGDYAPDSVITLSLKGFAEVESHDWLDLEFLSRSLLFPAAVSIVTTLITLFLKGVLS